MRAGSRYSCRKCDLEEVGPLDLCEPSCSRARDENGNAPPLSATEHQARIVQGKTPWVFDGLVQRPFAELAFAVREIRQRRRLARRLAACGSVQPIGAAREGLVRVEGRVTLVDPVRSPRDDSPCAAYLWRRSRRTGAAGTVMVEVTTKRAFGHFTVSDDTGVAVVDDDFVSLLDFHGREPEPLEPGGIVVHEGELVTLVGRAARGSREGVPISALAGFRDVTAPLVFNGTSDEPLLLFAANESSPPPPPKR